MLKKYFWIFIFFLLCSLTYGDGSCRPFFTPDELIVKILYKDNSNWWNRVADFENFVKQNGAIYIEKIFPTSKTGFNSGIDNNFLIRFSNGTALYRIISLLKSHQLVEDVDFNYLRRPCVDKIEPDDVHYIEQWNLSAIRAPEAWSLNKGSNELVIAVIDSGVDLQHEDLKNQFWLNSDEIADNKIDDDGNGYIDDINGWDFTDAPTLDGTGDYTQRDNTATDESGHGTHVSGIACAQTNNNIGIAGVSWNCKLMTLRAGFNIASGGSFLQDDDVAAAIVYAADNGAKVINMSWGDIVNSFIIRDAINYAYEKGCVLVAAAGNSSEDSVLYPAALTNVISVGAIDRNYNVASMSNYGEGIDLFAPGIGILSAQIHNRYGTMSGTSMATPHVSGTVGLILSKYPGLTNHDIRNILVQTSNSRVVDSAKALANKLGLSAKIEAKYSIQKPSEISLIGNACGYEFEKYLIEYSRYSEPILWFKLYESITPKWNEILYNWDISPLEEGNYFIRLNVFGNNQNPLIEKRMVKIDHSPPEITDVKIRNWIDNDEFHTIINFKTDEEAVCWINYRNKGRKEWKRLSTNKFSNTHNVNFSKFVEDDVYELFITAQNLSGLISVDDNYGKYYIAESNHTKIGSTLFKCVPNYNIPQMYLVDQVVDFNNNGYSEIIGMPIGGTGYSPVRIYENINNQYKLIFNSDEYFPWTVGDSDKDGLLEILGNNYETTFLIESASQGEFPTKKIWEIQGLWGGQMADLDRDGKIEIVSKNTNTNCIDIYKNVGNNSYLLSNSIINPTKGNNSISANYAIADFDGDANIELLAGDADGDIFIYEYDRNNQLVLVWNNRLEDSINAYNFAIGDFNGDGNTDFAVGARSADDKFGFENWHMNCLCFSSYGNNLYQPIFKQQFRTMRNSGNGITGADIDNDGIDELLIIAVPNAYIFKNSYNGWKAVWRYSAETTFKPAILDTDKDGMKEILFNLEDGLGFFARETDSRLAYRPYGLTASLLNENSVYLYWQTEHKPLSYKIYRKTDEQFQLLADNIKINEFWDNSVIKGKTYCYVVSSVISDGIETFSSDEVSVKFGKLPRLVSAKYIPTNHIELIFDKIMDSSAQVPENYILIKDQKQYEPTSSILDQNGKRVILSFPENDISEGKYKIIVKALKDIDGMPIKKEFSSIELFIKDDISLKLSQIKIYPNPISPDNYGAYKVIFENVLAGMEIFIYNVSGELVEHIEISENDNKRKNWWLSRKGKAISSGIYICVFEFNGQTITKKLCLIK